MCRCALLRAHSIHDDGRIEVQPYQPWDSPHGCPRPQCAVNMCKGRVVDELLAKRPYSSVLYVGDGGGVRLALPNMRPRARAWVWVRPRALGTCD